LGCWGGAGDGDPAQPVAAARCRSPQEFSRTLDWALRWVMIVGTPATVGLFMLAGPLLTTLFQYHAFTTHDAEMATRSLMAYAIGLARFYSGKVLSPGFSPVRMCGRRCASASSPWSPICC